MGKWKVNGWGLDGGCCWMKEWKSECIGRRKEREGVGWAEMEDGRIGKECRDQRADGWVD